MQALKFAAKELPQFNGQCNVNRSVDQCNVNRSVVSWLKEVELQLQFHRVLHIALGNMPRVWFTSLPHEEQISSQWKVIPASSSRNA
eukprot:763878-Hanusia_phi.AAC.4